MSELRFDEFTGAPVIIAAERKRIGGARPPGLPDIAKTECPFCPGHEAETEKTLMSVGDPWVIRVVSNKFPIMYEDCHAPSHPLASPARGAHEVVIESRDHDGDFLGYDVSHAARVLEVLRARVQSHETNPEVRAVSVFRNRGRHAGSSQPHPHSQLVALPYVPPAVQMRAARGPDVLGRAIEFERNEGARVIFDDLEVITFCPFASQRAWEARIALTSPCPRFSRARDAQLAGIADHLTRLLRRMSHVLGAFDYNLVLRDPPLHVDSFFTFDVFARTGGDAGFELQTGTSICVVTPEDAAHAFRTAKPPD
jgi:UDPglucose--hexose-1-phosphate uridylyltransferase